VLIERGAARTVASNGADTLVEADIESNVLPSRAALGLLPPISLLCAIGFALVAAAYYAGRVQAPWAESAFWIGMAVLSLPPLIRLLTASPTRAERVGLVILLAVGLYVEKVAYSPVAFTMPDELAHDYNLRQALQTGHLFHANPVLPVTALYPGLAGVTDAFASTTGLNDFLSGLIVAGATRVLLVLLLFLLVESLTHSARVAGLAAALYTANPNYLFYSAQFGYETLALPLSVLVLLAVLRRSEAPGRQRLAWTAFAVLAGLGVVISHHLTSYALVAALWATVIVCRVTRARPAPWDIAIVVSLGVAAWFVAVASSTWLYLAGALGPALVGIVSLLTLQQAPRQVFDPSPALGTATPIWQQLLAFGSIVLIALALPVGIVRLWRTSRRQSIAVLLGLAGTAYIPIQVLRLNPGSWETANRSSEFLFVGVGLLLGLAVVAIDSRWTGRRGWPIRIGLIGYVSVIFLGGVVVGWRPDLRVPRAYETQAMGQLIQPEGVALAAWAPQFLGVNNTVATDESNALLMAVYGQQIPWSGPANGVHTMMAASSVDSGTRIVLTSLRARYVVLDRRRQGADHLVGIYPLPGPNAAQPGQLLDPAVVARFDSQPDVSRIADTGDIVIYDVSRLSGLDPSATGG
jgi:hypothetical protein